MTLDEAIKHAEEVVEGYKKKLKVYENIDEDRPLFTEEETECRLCAEEHRQLAEWLRELEAYRGILANADKLIESEYGCTIIEGYADVLDKMNEVFKEANADDSN